MSPPRTMFPWRQLWELGELDVWRYAISGGREGSHLWPDRKALLQRLVLRSSAADVSAGCSMVSTREGSMIRQRLHV